MNTVEGIDGTEMSGPVATVTHVVPSIGRASFGLGVVAANLAHHQTRLGVRAQIWCLDSPREVPAACDMYRLNTSLVRCFPRVGPHSWCLTPRMERLARGRPEKHPHDVSVLHQHGIWTGLSRVTRRWSDMRRLPTVVAAHGSLDPVARRISSWKKRLALLAYESENLRACSCLHALTSTERDQYREFGLRNPIAVIANGLTAEWIDAAAYPGAFRRRLGIPDDIQVLLYLARITPKKGLPLLIGALRDLGPLLKTWRVVIAGVDEGNHQREVEALIDRAAMRSSFLFPGPLFGQEKRDAFAAADAFILPSLSEGFPIGVLEALGAGLPVLTTTAVPVEELRSGDYGWYTEATVDGIGSALRDALTRSRHELHAIGRRGREMVRRRYTWHQVSLRTTELYRWLLGKGPQPQFVEQ
jgi:glycosyltransferase involved in cell wall biosynthesis